MARSGGGFDVVKLEDSVVLLGNDAVIGVVADLMVEDASCRGYAGAGAGCGGGACGETAC